MQPRSQQTIFHEIQWQLLKMQFMALSAKITERNKHLWQEQWTKNPSLFDYYVGGGVALTDKTIVQATLLEVVHLFTIAVYLNIDTIWNALWVGNVSLQDYVYGLRLPEQADMRTHLVADHLLALLTSISKASRPFFEMIVCELKDHVLLEELFARISLFDVNKSDYQELIRSRINTLHRLSTNTQAVDSSVVIHSIDLAGASTAFVHQTLKRNREESNTDTVDTSGMPDTFMPESTSQLIEPPAKRRRLESPSPLASSDSAETFSSKEIDEILNTSFTAEDAEEIMPLLSLRS